MWVVISGILGILGFLISLINLIQYLLSRRINLEIQIKECVLRPYARGQKKLILHYQTNNKSNLPITITDLQVILVSVFMAYILNCYLATTKRTRLDSQFNHFLHLLKVQDYRRCCLQLQHFQANNSALNPRRNCHTQTRTLFLRHRTEQLRSRHRLNGQKNQ